jgi:hypothetical protein
LQFLQHPLDQISMANVPFVHLCIAAALCT